tara:strand:- start:418 stop:621 length:204 start_codon:yes stop_codon:yes gene_type:complete
MPSLDGYSLNEKMDRLHDDVQAQIEQLQKDFHNLYNMLDKMKEKPHEKARKESPKKTKKESLEPAKA